MNPQLTCLGGRALLFTLHGKLSLEIDQQCQKKSKNRKFTITNPPTPFPPTLLFFLFPAFLGGGGRFSLFLQVFDKKLICTTQGCWSPSAPRATTGLESIGLISTAINLPHY
jgi:hypothetical protein